MTFLESRDVIGHATIGLGVDAFLLVVSDGHGCTLHGYKVTSKALGSRP